MATMLRAYAVERTSAGPRGCITPAVDARADSLLTQAIAALASAGHDLLAVPALESDFEHVNGTPEHVVDLARVRRASAVTALDLTLNSPFRQLNRPIDVPPPADSSVPMQSLFSAQCSTHVASEAQYAPYTLSSNPPNPKSSFRANDWM
jgi:hypothetical protein